MASTSTTRALRCPSCRAALDENPGESPVNVTVDGVRVALTCYDCAALLEVRPGENGPVVESVE